MFKLKVIKKVGEVQTTVEIETDSKDMVLAILRHNDVISVDSDVPNRNIDPDWFQMIRLAEEYKLPTAPFTVTC